MRAHQLWWYEHLSRFEGETDGISNNWWEYAVDPNKVWPPPNSGRHSDQPHPVYRSR